ncbi:alpha/beta hydrolase [Euzebya tangerina]|uniref:alpha/beta hydrolase n=1 Tax=Euzebya tangerina TaxID=591198 RepID=UPI0013C35AE6|nr:alpha/beta fold hydrolase [Euzebya tangerina]
MYPQITADDGTKVSGVLRSPTPLEGTPGAGDRPTGIAVLLHPHPAYGGDRDVWLLPQIAQALAAADWASLRINFRGVGDSGGQQTSGELEHLDATAAMAWLRRQYPTVARAAVVGWSFGAMIGLRLGAAADHWIGIAPPTRQVEGLQLLGPLVPEDLPPRRSIIVGSDDQFFPPQTTSILRPDDVCVVEGTDHFFFDRDPEVADLVVSLLSGTATPSPTTSPTT